jgi:hypothetical protein
LLHLGSPFPLRGRVLSHLSIGLFSWNHDEGDENNQSRQECKGVRSRREHWAYDEDKFEEYNDD